MPLKVYKRGAVYHYSGTVAGRRLRGSTGTADKARARGEIFGPYATMDEAARVAREKWPEQEQDEAREGRGWDIQVAVRS